MPTQKNLRCTVHTKDGPLREYQANGVSPQTVYVESQNSAKFWIVFEALPGYKSSGYDFMKFDIYIDGEYMGSASVASHCKKFESYGVLSCKNPTTDYLQPFQFVEITGVEDPTEGNINEDLLPKFGEISIYARRSIRIGNSDNSLRKPLVQAQHVDWIHHDVLESLDLTHIMKICPKESRQTVLYMTSESLDSFNKPYAHFRILYRSKEVLRNLGLVPHTLPTSNPLDIERALKR